MSQYIEFLPYVFQWIMHFIKIIKLKTAQYY